MSSLTSLFICIAIIPRPSSSLAETKATLAESPKSITVPLSSGLGSLVIFSVATTKTFLHIPLSIKLVAVFNE